MLLDKAAPEPLADHHRPMPRRRDSLPVCREREVALAASIAACGKAAPAVAPAAAVWRRLALWSGVLLFTLPQIGGDEATGAFRHPDVRVLEFDLDAESPEELLTQLRHRGPKDDGGIVREGLTRWTVRWRPLDRDPQTVRSGTTYTIEVVLPRWNSPKTAPLELQEQWLRYMAAVRRHEAFHVRNALRFLSQLRKAVDPLDLSTPQERRHADRVAHNYILEMRRRDAEFDRLSEHGCVTGACGRKAFQLERGQKAQAADRYPS